MSAAAASPLATDIGNPAVNIAIFAIFVAHHAR